jgi:hypothetical protein
VKSDQKNIRVITRGGLKKIFAVFVLLILLFNSMGYYFLFELNKYQVQKSIQHHPERKSPAFCILRIPEPENNPSFSRIDKKEIRFQGKMYDIIKEVRNNNTTLFYCIRDTREDNLLAAMKRLTHDKFLLSLLNHIISVAPLPDYPEEIAVLASSTISFYSFQSPLCSSQLPTWSPPPEVS